MLGCGTTHVPNPQPRQQIHSYKGCHVSTIDLGTVRGSPSSSSRRLKDDCTPHRKQSLSASGQLLETRFFSPYQWLCCVGEARPAASEKTQAQSCLPDTFQHYSFHIKRKKCSLHIPEVTTI